MSDDAFHEIQLNGKQLVFLFMAAAVVAVVVFLSGVMVGRGVRAEKTAVTTNEAQPIPADFTAAVAAPAQTAQPPAPPAAGLGSATAGAPAVTLPPPVTDETSRVAPSKGATRPGPTAPAGAPASGDKSAAPVPQPEAGPRSAPADASSRAGAASVRPSGAPATPSAGFSVQVAAPTVRAAAEAIAKRLSAKGYRAYVLDPVAGGAPPVYYRVRVGPYKSRGEADEAKRRLEKEEQFKPFIIR